MQGYICFPRASISPFFYNHIFPYTIKNIITSLVFNLMVWNFARRHKISTTHWQTLQAGQCAALRIATGSVLMSSIDHLHAETNQLPVREHNHMISKQFLLATKKLDHPNHNQLPPRQRYRCMQGTLDSGFLGEVSIYLNNGTINTQEYKAALKDIHTQHVRQYIRSREPSVLNAPTPAAVSLLERNLDRRARTTLSQLKLPKMRTELRFHGASLRMPSRPDSLESVGQPPCCSAVSRPVQEPGSGRRGRGLRLGLQQQHH